MLTAEEINLVVDKPSKSFSRIGGNPPEALPNREDFLASRYYLFSIGPAEMPSLGDKCVSIFLDHDFAVYNDNTSYPDIGIKCVLHEPSARSGDTLGRLDAIEEGSLIPDDQREDYLVKIASVPVLIQREPSYESKLVADGYRFAFQFDENGYASDFVKGDYPFGYGGLYVYGRKNSEGVWTQLVAGFTQF